MRKLSVTNVLPCCTLSTASPALPIFMLTAPAARQGCASSLHCRSLRYREGPPDAAPSMSARSGPSPPCASSL
jgi:hypothetical protein